MNKDVLFGIVPIDETVTALDVEPFHCSADFGGDDLLLGLNGGFMIVILVVGHCSRMMENVSW